MNIKCSLLGYSSIHCVVSWSNDECWLANVVKVIDQSVEPIVFGLAYFYFRVFGVRDILFGIVRVTVAN